MSQYIFYKTFPERLQKLFMNDVKLRNTNYGKRDDEPEYITLPYDVKFIAYGSTVMRGIRFTFYTKNYFYSESTEDIYYINVYMNKVTILELDIHNQYRLFGDDGAGHYIKPFNPYCSFYSCLQSYIDEFNK